MSIDKGMDKENIYQYVCVCVDTHTHTHTHLYMYIYIFIFIYLKNSALKRKETLPCATTWVGLEDIVQSDVSLFRRTEIA